MSTRIDISVAGDLLRRLNRSQQQANRQGLQERERRASLTQRGTITRQEFNRSQGRAADGTPLGRRPLQPRFLEEPAATPLLARGPAGGQFFAIWSGVASNDTVSVKVSSGDGTQWATAQLSLPGATAFYEWNPLGQTLDPITGTGSGPLFDGSLYASDPRGLVIYYHSHQIDRSFDRLIVLPADNGSAVVVFVKRFAYGKHVIGYRCTDGFAFASVGGIRWRATALELPGQEYTRTIGVTAAVAFHVTHTSVKEVPVPGGLQTALDRIYPQVQWSENYLYKIDAINTDPNTPGKEYGPAYQYCPAPGTAGEFMPAQQIQETVLNQKTNTVETVTQTLAFYKLNWALDAFSPTTYYGSDEYFMTVDGYNYINGYATTPATFYVLTQPQAFADIDYDSLSNNYSELLTATGNALTAAGARLPAFTVSYDIRAGTALRAAHDAVQQGQMSGAMSAFYEDPLDLITQWEFAFISRTAAATSTEHTGPWRRAFTLPFTTPRPSLNTIYSAPFDQSRLWCYWFSDWGQPRVCRAQLKELGFTDEDLTP